MAVITMVGASMMGCAVCVPLCDRGHDVRVVGTPFDRKTVESLRATGLHPALKLELPRFAAFFHDDVGAAMEGCEVIALGVGSAGIEWATDAIAPFATSSRPIVMVTKGLRCDGTDLLVLPDVVRTGLGERFHPVALCGPCIAGEIARRAESCVVVAGRDPSSRAAVAAVLRTPYCHVFESDDVVGVSVCAALKNAYAMGCAFGIGLHEKNGGRAGSVAMHNYESAVFAQAAFEMQRIVRLCGGRDDTVLGLAGVGDLDVTNNGGRMGRFGRLLGLGLPATEAIAAMEGATLECLEILRVMRDATTAWRGSGRLSEPLPLLDHLAEVALDDAPVAMPFDAFFR
jgi:glycerol-3-phosphate dehydrogenase (NAD(P)+)